MKKFILIFIPLILFSTFAQSEVIFVFDLNGTLYLDGQVRPGVKEVFEATALFPDSKVVILSSSDPAESEEFINGVSLSFFGCKDFLSKRFSVTYPRKFDIDRRGINDILPKGINPLNVIHVNDSIREHRSGDPYAFFPVTAGTSEAIRLKLGEDLESLDHEEALLSEFRKQFSPDRELQLLAAILRYIREHSPGAGERDPIAPLFNQIVYGVDKLTEPSIRIFSQLKGEHIIPTALLGLKNSSEEINLVCKKLLANLPTR